MNAAFPDRHITSPAALDRALREDKDMRLVRRFGKLELFALRASISPADSVTRYATVNSATPDLRDLALLPYGTSLISSPMRPGVPAVLQSPPVSQWQLAGDELETSIVEPPGRRYNTKLLSSTGAFEPPGASSSAPRARLTARVRPPDARAARGRSPGAESRPAHRPRPPSRWPGGRRAQLQAGRFLAQRRRLRVWHVGPGGQLCGVSRDGSDSAAGCPCPAWTGPGGTAGARALRERGQCVRGALAGLAVRTALREPMGPQRQRSWTADVPLAEPIDECAAMSPLPSSSVPSRWYHYQAIVTPDPGTRSLSLFLYADVYTSGAPTTNEYSDVVVRRCPVLLQPVVVATPRGHERPVSALYTVGESFSPDWIGPPGDQHVEVDGLRSGWLGPNSRDDPPHFSLSSWYLLSRLASLLAAGLLLALALPRSPGGRYRPVAVPAASEGQEHG